MEPLSGYLGGVESGDSLSGNLGGVEMEPLSGYCTKEPPHNKVLYFSP